MPPPPYIYSSSLSRKERSWRGRRRRIRAIDITLSLIAAGVASLAGLFSGHLLG